MSPAPASRLIVATRGMRATVEQLKEMFKDLNEEPHIREIPQKLDYKLMESFSSIALAQPLEGKEPPVFYGHLVDFQTANDARNVFANHNFRTIPGSPHPGLQIIISQPGLEYDTDAMTARNGDKIIHPTHNGSFSFMKIFSASWVVILLQSSWASVFGILGGAPRRFKEAISSNLYLNQEFARSDDSSNVLNNLIRLHSSDLLVAIDGLRRELIPQHQVSSSKVIVPANDSGISNVLLQMEADINSYTSRSDFIREDLEALKKSMNDDNDIKQKELAKFVHLQEVLIAKEKIARLETLAVKDQFSELQKTMKRATDDAAARANELGDAIQTVCRLKCEVRTLHNTASLQEASVKAEKTKWETELKAYYSRIHDLEKSNKGLESSLTSVTTESVSLRSEANAALSACQMALAEEQKQFKALKSRICQLELQSGDLKNQLIKSETSTKQRSAECERWRIQCQVSDAEITRLKEEIEGRAEVRKTESRREELLKSRIETKYGRMDQVAAWDDEKAFKHIDSTLNHYENTVFSKEKPLTMRGVPWPVMDDPRWLFALQNIQPVSVETCLRKYQYMIAKRDNSAYAAFLCKLRAVFHQDKWNATHRLATTSNPVGYVEAGLIVIRVVEAELKTLVPVMKKGQT